MTFREFNSDGSKNIKILGSNVKDYALITPNDTTLLPKQAIAFMVGVSGAIALTKPDGTNITLPGSLVPAQTIISLPFTRVKATGTTATSILVVYGE